MQLLQQKLSFANSWVPLPLTLSIMSVGYGDTCFTPSGIFAGSRSENPSWMHMPFLLTLLTPWPIPGVMPPVAVDAMSLCHESLYKDVIEYLRQKKLLHIVSSHSPESHQIWSYHMCSLPMVLYWNQHVLKCMFGISLSLITHLFLHMLKFLPSLNCRLLSLMIWHMRS